MKKLYVSFVLILFLLNSAIAATHTVVVSNFKFDPNSLTVNVGDTILWTWSNGTHNTVSTQVPAGANSWNSPINSSATSFSYVVTAEGTYNYECTIHSFL